MNYLLAKHQALTHYQEQARIATLEQQRNELAEALRNMLETFSLRTGYGPDASAKRLQAKKQARAALARIKS